MSEATLRAALAPTLRIADLHLVHVRVSPQTVWSFVRVFATDGATGVGECTLMRDARALDAPFAAAHAALSGQPVFQIAVFAAHGERSTLPVAAVASALEQAAWDLAGRRAGRPVATLLGPVRSTIPLYANLNRRTVDRTPAGFFASAEETRAAGYDAFKIAPFDAVTPATAATAEGRAATAQGIARAAAVREAIGPDAALFVDCHWRFTPATARAALRALAELGVSWFECPLPESEAAIPDLVALRRDANAAGMRLAGLEALESPEAFAPYLAAGAYDVVMPDVKYVGGIAALTRTAAEAQARGIACAPHNPTGPVGHAASLAACAHLPGLLVLEHQYDETPLFFALAGEGLPVPQQGASALPAGPGLGTALDLDVVPEADVVLL